MQVERARHLLELGRVDEAAAVLTDHLTAQPNDSEALILLAACAAEKGLPADALRHADAALKHDPDDPWVMEQAAEIHFEHGNRKKGREMAEKAVNLDPGRPSAHQTYALMLARSKPRSKAGRYHAARAIELAPNDPRSWNADGAVSYARNRKSDADASFRRALELDPTNEGLRRNLALVQEASGRQLSAMLMLESLVRESPDDVASRQRIDRIAIEILADVLWLSLPLCFVLIMIADSLTGAN